MCIWTEAGDFKEAVLEIMEWLSGVAFAVWHSF